MLISLTVVSLGYGLAEHLEVSGPIAMVVAGLVVGNYSLPRLAAEQREPFDTLKAERLGLTNLLTWGGLRGGLAVAMAMSLPAGTEKDVILHMTYGVVAFSIIVQGLNISRFFKADQLKRLLN